MKKLMTTAGLAAIGAVSLQAASPQALTKTERSKPWSISASLRAFYDDNYTTANSDLRRDSFGVEFSPRFSANISLDQTYLGFSYTYAGRWYEDRSDDPFDHNHQFEARANHNFTDRYRLEFYDSFVIAQEPELLDPNTLTTPLRTEGDNMRNYAELNFNAQLTELLGVLAGYSNTYYDYDQTGEGSRSALLDRIQHLVTLNVRYQILRQTVGLLGYQFGAINYTSDDPIFFDIMPEIRDNFSHYFYVGADHQFNPKFNGSARAGVQYTDYYNADETQISPYADVSVTWLYRPSSSAQLGLRHARNQTDVGVFFGGTSVLDQESTSIYASVNHQITGKLLGSLLAQFQNSTFSGGDIDGDVDQYWMLGLNLNYKINNFLSAETGYNYDRLDSDLGARSFTRNRVYIGIRATY